MRGRSFTDADRAGTQLVVMVNRKLAEHFWPNQSPIGKRMRIGTPEMQTPWMTIVGEVADVKLSSPDDPTKEQFYQPVDQVEEAIGSLGQPGDLNGNGGYIALRSALPPEQMKNALRATVRSIDPQLPLTQVQTMEQAVSETEAPRRFNTVLITSFALRRNIAGGARHLQHHRLLGRLAGPGSGYPDGARIATRGHRSSDPGIGSKARLIGCAVGLAGAVAASGLLRSLLFGVSPFDPLVLVLAAVGVLLLAVAASALPAFNAASIDPVQALRGE